MPFLDMLVAHLLVLLLLILLGSTDDVTFLQSCLANRVADDQAQEEQHCAAGNFGSHGYGFTAADIGAASLHKLRTISIEAEATPTTAEAKLKDVEALTASFQSFPEKAEAARKTENANRL
ncbi:hypothetical protein AK812_SmicGene8505 [Symbiodinium microadriaticum]|uniref:Uncharacterized protein n=1 Tax=Symbiodinium microadriaticum TaxID=2951 RepID=A0A1Q9EKN1_SYMMI|nr:hypothetical protein AK812_SmicGene8505 [Symbiodinium microadriaticum]